MEYYNKTFCLDVSGNFACFTRPEMKVERVSYDVMTPSAARGIFQAIFWKPAIQWNIKKIEVLNDIKFVSVRRNEVRVKMNPASGGIFADDTNSCRAQRASLILRDVRYRIHAELEFIPVGKRPLTSLSVPNELISPEEGEHYKKDENPGKYNGIFERRAKKGQCFTHPYLGCREFSCCSFSLVEDIDGAKLLAPPIPVDKELGYMLYDLDFSDVKNPKPAFFRAKLENGVLNVPSWNSEEVRK